jgi:hypothetical protein
MPPSTVDFVSMRKTWAVSGLLSIGRVGSTDDGIRSTTLALFRGRVGLTDDVTRETTLALFMKGGTDRGRDWISHFGTPQGRSGIDRWWNQIDHFGTLRMKGGTDRGKDWISHLGFTFQMKSGADR